jgi:DNA-binding transcriptional regulator YiaG
MSQKEFVKLIGVSVDTQQNWEGAFVCYSPTCAAGRIAVETG